MGACGALPAHAPGVTFLIPALSGELIWKFASGAISDRIGRRPVLMGITVLALLTTCPVMHWLTVAPDFTRMTLALLWFSFFFDMYNGAMVAALTEVMPVHVRTVGFSLAFSLATAIFGDLTPAISTALVELTGDKSPPGWWLMCAGLVANVRRAVRIHCHRATVRAAEPRLSAGGESAQKKQTGGDMPRPFAAVV
ncbi:putative citrate utilization protein A [Klebsiella pneumoniae]|nr:putative citrate utilization protein A [Klebsiella pneumoniae]